MADVCAEAETADASPDLPEIRSPEDLAAALQFHQQLTTHIASKAQDLGLEDVIPDSFNVT